MAGSMKTPQDFSVSRAPAKPAANQPAKSLELLPPSSFLSKAKPEDPWKKLSEATAEMMQLRLENQRLKEQKQAQCLLGEKEIKARVDLHHSPPMPQPPPPQPPPPPDTRHLDQLIQRQANEIAELKMELKQARSESQQEIARIEGERAAKEVSAAQERSALEENARMMEEKYKKELSSLTTSHEQAMSAQMLEMSQLKAELDLSKKSHLARIQHLEQQLQVTEAEKEKNIAEMMEQIRAKDHQLNANQSEIKQLRSYITETQEYAQSTERWKTEKVAMETEIKELETQNSTLESSLQLLNTRLSSLNEILTIQENEMTKYKHTELDNKKKANNLLTRWREKVFALLVQQKSVDIVHKKDEQNWKRKLSSLEHAIETSHNQCQMLTHSLSDKTAELELERNNVKTIQNELTKAQQMALSLDTRIQQDTEKMAALVQICGSIDQTCASYDQAFQQAMLTLKTQGQRISYASGRVQMLQGQYARKEAMYRLKLSHKEEEDKQSAMEEQEATDIEEMRVSYTNVCSELDRVTAERDSLVEQIRMDAHTVEERVEELKLKYQEQIESLQTKIAFLESQSDEQSQKCSLLSHQLEQTTQHLTDKTTALEELKLILAKQEAGMEKELQSKEADIKQLYTEQLAEMERQLNDVRREHAKAVISMRQTERCALREKERLNEHTRTLEEHYKMEIEKLQQQILATEKDRSLLMTTLRQEGLVGKYKAQRDPPLGLPEDKENHPGATPLQDLAEAALGMHRKESITSVLEDLKSLTATVLEEMDSDASAT